MLQRLKNLLAPPSDEAKRDSVPLASAALLVEGASMDGHMSGDEAQRIRAMMRDRFDLSQDEADDLVEEARQRIEGAGQILPFTRAIKDNYDHDQRVEMIEMLWEVVYADGHLHDYEANLVRRISGLIYVSDQESGAARKRALARLGLDDGTA